MYRVFSVQLAALSFFLISCPLLAGPVGEHAGEIWIDGPEDKQPGLNPRFPDAAVDKAGRSIFVWDGNPAINGGNDVWLRIFDSSGAPPTDPVRVNTLLDNNQHYPRVAVGDDGAFLVIWQSDEVPDGGSARRKVVRSQAFNANAQVVGSEQLLSTLPTLKVTEVSADVAVLNDGSYVVAWFSAETTGDDTGSSVQARRVGADGVPLGEQFQVNARNSGASENFPSVTGLAGGGFLVVWVNPEVHGRRFNADGTPAGDDFQISTSTLGSKFETDIVQHEDGRILVIWKDDEDAADSWEIRGRLFSQNLVAQGADFRINTVIAGGQQHQRVADYGQGGFFVVWESGTSSGGDNFPSSIEGRIVTGSNQFAGPQFLVNEWTEDSQQFPGIGGKRGRIAVAWDSQSRPGANSSAILGQFWSICGIFCDSFEGE